MKFIIAPRHSFKYLLSSFRKDDPFFNVDLLSKEDLMRSIYPFVGEDALIYLVKEKGFSIDLAEFYLKYLPYVSKDYKNNKLHNLYQLRCELLEKGLMSFSKTNYKNAECVIFYYSSLDHELVSALNSLNIKYRFIENESDKEFDYYEFDCVEDEIYFTLNRIASLIDKGVSPNDIYIINRNSSYDYYLKKFASTFGFEINLKSKETLYSTGAAKEFIALFDKEKDIKRSLDLLKESMKEDPLYLDIEDAVESVINNDLNFELQKAFVIRKLKSKYIKTGKYKNAISVIKEPLVSENKTYFVLGFAQGLYPSIDKSNSLVTDMELKEINRLNSKEKTKKDEYELINAFKSNNTFIFSFSKQSRSENYFLSPIQYQITLNKKSVDLDDVIYSRYATNLKYAALKDLDYFYKEAKDDYLRLQDVCDIEYASYDYQYKDKAPVYEENDKITLSTSSLEKFSKCPFYYYLESIAKIDSFEGNYNTDLGKLVHYLIEHSREKDFNFDEEFNKFSANLDLSVSERYSLDHRLKERIQEAIESIKIRENGYVNPSIKNEEWFNYKLTDNTSIVGAIDNLVVLDDKYYICVDYKTGSTKFETENLEHGLSTQLPTYSLLVNAHKDYKDLEVIGLYINNVIDKSLKNETNPDKIIKDCYKLNGKTIDIIDEISYIDPSISSGDSLFISGLHVGANGSINSKSVITKEEFERYREIVYQKYLDMDKELRNNNFPINPYYISAHQNACTYCGYKDICFKKKGVWNKIKEEIDE